MNFTNQEGNVQLLVEVQQLADSLLGHSGRHDDLDLPSLHNSQLLRLLAATAAGDSKQPSDSNCVEQFVGDSKVLHVKAKTSQNTRRDHHHNRFFLLFVKSE